MRGSVLMTRLAVAVALAAILAGGALALRESAALYRHPLQEDGYLALTVARQLGLGRGLTIDGEQQTNGFQPLWVLIASLCFLMAGGDRAGGLHLVVLAQTLVYATGAWLAWRCAILTLRRARVSDPELPAAVFAAVFLCNQAVWENAYSGMESGLLSVGYLGVLLVLLTRGVTRLRDALALGSAAGLLVLVRIDAGFFVLGLGVLAAFAGRGAAARSRVTWLGVYGATAVAVTLPWWWYNLATFGHLMPISGLATTGPWSVNAGRALAAAAAVLRGLVPLAAFRNLPPPTAALVHLLSIGGQILVIVLCSGGRSGRGARDAGWRLRTYAGALLFGTLCLWFWYAGRSTAVWFFPRYFSYLAIGGCALTAWCLVAVHTRSRVLGIVGLVLVAALHVRSNGYAFTAGCGVPEGPPGTALALVSRNVDPAATVAAGQTGVLGFFRDRVLNLDGKVNPQVLPYRGRLNDYLDMRGVDWVCDDDYVRRIGFDPGRPGWEVAARDGSVTLWHRSGFR